MSRRPIPAALAIAFGILSAACRDRAPWEAPDWRPERAPQRIVAASVLAAEVLLEIAPRERIVGVHYLAADPTFSLVASDVKGLRVLGAEPEQLLACGPDLVICDPFTKPETLALLASASVPVIKPQNPATFDDVAANVLRIGAVCHLDEPAAQLVASMRQRLAALAGRVTEVADWRVVNIAGGMHVHGRGSLFDAVVTAAGARNVASERGVGPFRKLDVETLLGWNPDAVVISGPLDAAAVLPAWLQQIPGMALLRCVAHRRVVRIQGPSLGTTSHRLVEAAEQLQATLRGWGRP
ncbi:MAG TPA: ABC transporter substrate-binding protein [Planctomycetota bacterium]|nr:ABC transporter substrate-binding protein [Planctomycetota bacterium]